MIDFAAQYFDNIEANRAVNLPAVKIILRRFYVFAFSLIVDRLGRRTVIFIESCFYLDKRDGVVLSRDYIYFAERIDVTAFQNFITVAL